MPAAAALGATLFFDQRLSRNGKVACATCHKIDRQFQDDLPHAAGLGTTNRRTMPLAGVAWSPWFFWDGRRDSLWSQALTPLENPSSMPATAPPMPISWPKFRRPLRAHLRAAA